MSTYAAVWKMSVFVSYYLTYFGQLSTVILVLLTALLLFLFSLQAMDHRSEHTLSRRSTCQDRIDYRIVPGIMYQKCCVYRV